MKTYAREMIVEQETQKMGFLKKMVNSPSEMKMIIVDNKIHHVSDEMMTQFREFLNSDDSSFVIVKEKIKNVETVRGFIYDKVRGKHKNQVSYQSHYRLVLNLDDLIDTN